MRFFNITPLEGESNVYIGEATIFSLDPHKVTIALPFAANFDQNRVELFTRDGKLYARLKDRPVEVKIPIELIRCKKNDLNATCEIDPIIYNILHIGEWNTEDGWHINYIEKDEKNDVYKIIGTDGNEYILSPDEFLSENWHGKYLNLFQEDGQLKGIVAFINRNIPEKVLMYKANIPKKAIRITGSNESKTRFYGNIDFP